MAVSHYLLSCQTHSIMNEEVVGFHTGNLLRERPPRIPLPLPALARHSLNWGGNKLSLSDDMLPTLEDTNVDCLFVCFQYLVELVSKEMRVSDKAVRVSELEL